MGEYQAPALPWESGAREGSDDRRGGGHTTKDQHRPSNLTLVAELWERTSAKGTRYLSGFLGKAQLVGFEAREQPREGVTVWRLFVSPGKGATDERR